MRGSFAGGYEITRLGLTGPGYQYTSGGGVFHNSTIKKMNEAGQVAGTTIRYTSSGTYFGNHAWLFNGTSTQVLGLTGGVYEYTTSDGVFRRTDAGWLNNAGDVVGDSLRFSGATDIFGSLGRDAWLFDGTSTQIIGLTGSGYERSATGGVHRFSSATYVNDAGQVAGFSNRFGDAGQELGQDAWRFNGNNTHVIGPTGGVYEHSAAGGVHRNAFVSVFNNAGQAAGFASRSGNSAGSLGSDAWFFDGANTQFIGLTGSGYEFMGDGGVYRSALPPQAINSTGQVAGLTGRFNSAGDGYGFDSWLFDGASTHQVGLLGSAYEYTVNGHVARYSQVQPLLTDDGLVAGRSVRFTATGDVLGQDAWIFDGASTQIMGLIGSGYEYNAGGGIYRLSAVTGLNNDGEVTGGTERYSSTGTPLGYSAWFFDSATGITTPLEFSVRGTDNYSNTLPLLVRDGVVFGTYELFDGAVSLGERLFWWSLDEGLHNLGALGDLVDGGLAAAGWQALSSMIFLAGSVAGGPPRYIAGPGAVLGQSGGESVYLLTATPAEGLPGDFNGDDSVDAADYVVWRKNFGSLYTTDDFNIWRAHFGATAGSGSIAASHRPGMVPEPTSMWLVALCWPIALRITRKRGRLAFY